MHDLLGETTPPPTGKRKKAKAEPDGAVQQCIDAYFQGYQTKWGIKPVMRDMGKYGKWFKQHLESMQLEHLLQLLQLFFCTKDPEITKRDYSLDVFFQKIPYLHLKAARGRPIDAGTAANLDAAHRAMGKQ